MTTQNSNEMNVYYTMVLGQFVQGEIILFDVSENKAGSVFCTTVYFNTFNRRILDFIRFRFQSSRSLLTYQNESLWLSNVLKKFLTFVQVAIESNVKKSPADFKMIRARDKGKYWEIKNCFIILFVIDYRRGGHDYKLAEN